MMKRLREDAAGSGEWTLALACLFSGGAALVFENVWFRAAGLVLGNSVWSAAVVTAAFMAGLGIGNFLTVAWARRIGNLARAYAGVELGIALFGWGSFLLLFRGQGLLASLLAPWHDLPVALQLVRSAIALAVLVVPAVGIGATLPLLVGLPGRRPFGVRLAGLYAWNTLGAVAGSLAAEFLLMDALGLSGTAAAAGLGNLAAGALVLSRRTQPAVAERPAGAPEDTAGARPAGALSRNGRRLLGAVALCGLNLLALEVLWFRFLQLFFNGTARTFAIMLALVLAGLSLGGALAARWLGRNRGPGLIRTLCFSAGALVVLTYALFPHVAALGGSSTRALVVHAAFLMMPLCVLSGALYGVMGAALHEEVGEPVRATGLLTLANTIGAMAGPLLAAFVLLPGPGIERSFFLAAALYGIAGLTVGGAGRAAEPFWRRWLVPAGALALILAAFPFGQMRDVFHAGVARRLPGATLLRAHEGRTETSFYFRHDAMGRPFYHRLVTHGYSMSASDPRSKRYMKLFAWLPLALRPEARSALLICFGVGSTARALTDTPGLERIDVVDISRDVLAFSDLIFPPPERHPLRDPRVTTRVEDGRFYLQTTPRTYDLITGEPPPTKIAGVVNLYTEEFFRLVRQRLNPGGWCSYWLPVYQMQPHEARSIIRAFLNVFPEGSLWEGGGLNWILLGPNGAGTPPSAAGFAQAWTNPDTAAELARLGVESPGQLAATFLADAAELGRFCGEAPPLTDARPHLLSTDMRDRSPGAPEFRGLADAAQARARFESSAWVAAALPAGIRAAAAPLFRPEHFLNYALHPLYRPEADAMAADTREVLRTTDLRTLPLWLVGSSPHELAIAREEAAAGRRSAEVVFHLAAGELSARNYPAAAELLRESIRLNVTGGGPPVDVLTRTLAGL
jgi:predicted membrane-bound spermidine synthase